MSEHERGAYTPQPDAPLSFDARISRERRPFPLALLASCALLGALIVAVFLFYRSGVRGPRDAPMPVGTPVEQYKSPPPTASAPNSLSIQTSAPPEAGTTGLAPATEQPVKRALAPEPAAPVATVAQTPPGAPAPVQTQPAPVAAQPVAQAPASQKPVSAPLQAKAAPAVVKAAPVSAPPVLAPPVKAPPAKAVQAKEKAKPMSKDVAELLADDTSASKAHSKAVATKSPSAKPTATSASLPAASKGGGIVVQIGAYLNEAQANDAWQKVAGLMGGAISGKGRHIEPVVANDVTRYRSQITGFASRADAATFCSTLKSRKHDCIVKVGD